MSDVAVQFVAPRFVAVRFVVESAPAPPSTDQLGPATQDPEAVRETACRLVASEDVCTVSTVDRDPPPVAAPPAGGGVAVVSLLLWAVLAVAVVLLIVVVVRSLVARGARKRKTEDDSADDDAPAVDELATVAVDRSREPVNWRTEADEHRRAGRYRDSLRCRYRALVGDLARSGLIDEVPGRTTGEERSQLRRVQPAADQPFTSAADLFDGAWYGHLEVGERDDDEFIELEQRVLQASRGSRS